MTTTSNTAASKVAAFAKGATLFMSLAADRNPAAPVLFGTIDGVNTSLFMAKGTDRKFMNVVQEGKQVGTANVRIVDRGIEQLVITVGAVTHWATFRKEVTTDERVAMGLDVEKLTLAKAANAARKVAANDDKAAIAA